MFVTNLASGGYYDTGLSEGGKKASAYGGALFAANSTVNAVGCRFEVNLGVSPESVNIGGSAQGANVFGGAIHHEGDEPLRLQNSVFVANQALGGNSSRDGRSGDALGGAVSTYGSLVADQCLFASNACFGAWGSSSRGGWAYGGALLTANAATLNHCLFSANWAHAAYGGYVQNGNAYGGAVYAQGVLQILNSTFSSNWVEGTQILNYVNFPPNPGSVAGGALFSTAVCVATNSTWFQNHADAQTEIDIKGRIVSQGAATGAAIYQIGNRLTLVNSTIASNSIVSVTNSGSTITIAANAQLSACLLSGNVQGNLSGSIVDQGFNLSSDHSLLLTNATSHNDIDPKLGDFGDHGGPTPTLALLPGSLAIDAITLGPCPDTDQRGVPRPIGADCDIGAFEFLPPPTLSLNPSATFHVQEVLQPARDYQIDVSTNLIDWAPFSTNRSDTLGKLTFTDTTSTNAPYRFYRLTPKQ